MKCISSRLSRFARPREPFANPAAVSTSIARPERDLEGRSARLSFDGEVSGPIQTRAGVPQGSPLSPILFLLYIASLYEALLTNPRLLIVGFADDTNIIAVSWTIEGSCRLLEEAWRICEKWARTRDMASGPEKSKLIHFTRTRAAPPQTVRLGGATVASLEAVCFLGVWPDRKLRWKTHLQEIKDKHKSKPTRSQ